MSVASIISSFYSFTTTGGIKTISTLDRYRLEAQKFQYAPSAFLLDEEFVKYWSIPHC